MKPDASALLAALAKLLAPHLAAELAPHLRKGTAAEPLLVAVDLALGCSRRHAAELCRARRIPGAVMVAKRWSAPREALAAYAASLAEEPTRGADDGDANMRKLAREMGLEVARP